MYLVSVNWLLTLCPTHLTLQGRAGHRMQTRRPCCVHTMVTHYRLDPSQQSLFYKQRN